MTREIRIKFLKIAIFISKVQKEFQKYPSLSALQIRGKGGKGKKKIKINKNWWIKQVSEEEHLNSPV